MKNVAGKIKFIVKNRVRLPLRLLNKSYLREKIRIRVLYSQVANVTGPTGRKRNTPGITREICFNLTHEYIYHQEMKVLQLRIRRKFALRGEVLLFDMEEVQPNHDYTLEKGIELLYIDLIDKF